MQSMLEMDRWPPSNLIETPITKLKFPRDRWKVHTMFQNVAPSDSWRLDTNLVAAFGWDQRSQT